MLLTETLDRRDYHSALLPLLVSSGCRVSELAVTHPDVFASAVQDLCAVVAALPAPAQPSDAQASSNNKAGGSQRGAAPLKSNVVNRAGEGKGGNGRSASPSNEGGQGVTDSAHQSPDSSSNGAQESPKASAIAKGLCNRGPEASAAAAGSSPPRCGKQAETRQSADAADSIAGRLLALASNRAIPAPAQALFALLSVTAPGSADSSSRAAATAQCVSECLPLVGVGAAAAEAITDGFLAAGGTSAVGTSAMRAVLRLGVGEPAAAGALGSFQKLLHWMPLATPDSAAPEAWRMRIPCDQLQQGASWYAVPSKSGLSVELFMPTARSLRVGLQVKNGWVAYCCTFQARPGHEHVQRKLLEASATQWTNLLQRLGDTTQFAAVSSITAKAGTESDAQVQVHRSGDYSWGAEGCDCVALLAVWPQ